MSRLIRKITPEDLEAAKALSRLWDEYKQKNKGATQEGVAAQLGWSQSMFAQLKGGKIAWSTNHVLSVAKFFGAPINSIKHIPALDSDNVYAIHHAKTPRAHNPNRVDENHTGYGNIEAGPDIRGKVPLISWVQAGMWMEIIDNFAPGDAEEWLPCPVKHSPATYVLRVRGESMFNPTGRPSFSDGDMIFVDPEVQPINGSLVIVRLEDENDSTFKRLIIEGDRQYLKALNPAWPEQIIRINNNAQISGVVIMKAEKI